MRSHRFFRRKIIGSAIICTAGCAIAHQTPFAGSIRLPLPTITSVPQTSVSPSPFILLPTTTTTSTPVPGMTPTPTISSTPAPSPIPLETPIPLATPTPTVWIENSQESGVRVTEQEAPQAPFLEEAHLVSLDGLESNAATHAVSIRIRSDAIFALDAHVVRKNNYGSSDVIGAAHIDRSAGTATFAAHEANDYLLAGKEIYTPPDNAYVPIAGSINESIELDSNASDVSSANVQSVVRRRIMSANDSPHVKNYLKEREFVVRPVILFLHGMGERNPKKLWSRITTYLKTAASNRDQMNGTIFSIPTYDSLQAVHVSKERIKQLLLQTVGSVPLIIGCHSMGCLVARDLAADPDIKDTVVGGVLLAAANGSPWVPKKRMRPSLADQPDATALLTAQALALAKVMPNVTEYYSSIKSLASIVRSLDEGTMSKGALSLATARADIPVRTYQLRFNVGIYPFPFKETLTPDDAYTLPCSDDYFPQIPRDPRYRYGNCFANFARELRTWERQQGLDRVPRWYAYAGHFRGNELRSARATFMRRLVSLESIALFLADQTGILDEEALKFAASLLADRITSTGIQKRLTDGLVDDEDALLLDDGPSIESAQSRRDNLLIDSAIVEQRRPKDVIATREVLRSHREIVYGTSANDSELFGSIAADFGALLANYRSQPLSYEDSELDSVREEIEKSYHATQTFQDFRGSILGIETTTVQFAPTAPCSQTMPCADLPYTVVRIYHNWSTGEKTTTPVKSESRRAYRVWRVWRLFDG